MTPKEEFNIIKDLVKSRLKEQGCPVKGHVTLLSNGLKYNIITNTIDSTLISDIMPLAKTFDIDIYIEKSFVKIISSKLVRSSSVNPDKMILAQTFNIIYKLYHPYTRFAPPADKSLQYGGKRLNKSIPGNAIIISKLIEYLPKLNQLSEKFEYQTRIDNNYQLFYITPKS